MRVTCESQRPRFTVSDLERVGRRSTVHERGGEAPFPAAESERSTASRRRVVSDVARVPVSSTSCVRERVPAPRVRERGERRRALKEPSRKNDKVQLRVGFFSDRPHQFLFSAVVVSLNADVRLTLGV
jgi:hypothetical protein